MRVLAIVKNGREACMFGWKLQIKEYDTKFFSGNIYSSMACMWYKIYLGYLRGWFLDSEFKIILSIKLLFEGMRWQKKTKKSNMKKER